MSQTLAKGFIDPAQFKYLYLAGEDITEDSLGRKHWWFKGDGCWCCIDIKTGVVEIGEGAA
jgi:hypothetical protein